MRKIWILLAITTGTWQAAQAQVPAQTIPQFSFARPGKKPFSNKDLPAGKQLFFVFFDTDCEHCQHTVAYIGRHYQDFRKMAIFLITLDNETKIAGFMQRYGAGLAGKKNVLLLRDEQNQFIARFSPRRYPSMFLYSPEKKLLDYEDNEESVFRIVNMAKKQAF